MRLLLAAALAVALMLAPTSMTAAAGAANPMVDKINQTRAAHGLPPLRESASLTRSSQRYGHTLMRANRFGHSSRIRASGRFRRLGEILALHRGWKLRRAYTVRAWLNSPPHRSVILSRSFRYVGAWAVKGKMGRGRSTVWVAHFGRR